MGRILIIRHAIAEDADAALAQGRDDAARGLTDEGRQKFSQAVKGLARVVTKIDVLVASPLLRAVQTGEILSQQFIAPGAAPGALLEWYLRHAASECVALVGHEPSHSLWASELLTGRETSILKLKKGAACLLELDSLAPKKPALARLLWLLQPSQLRLLAS